MGFSYDAASSNQPTAGDNSTATDNLAALDAFFVKFPKLTSNEFYVAGESYGGVYVPTLALKILEAGNTFKGNMKGCKCFCKDKKFKNLSLISAKDMVGNGVFDFEDSQPTKIEMAVGHGFISAPFATQAQTICQDSNFTGMKCQKVLTEINSQCK